MSLAILDFPASTPTARDLMERALDPYMLVGMPHLTPHGLSETWLMKELGHRHWLMLARDMAMDNADFRTSSGAEAYAAICATSLRHARLERVAANDILTIRSSLVPVSRTQMSSLHRLSVGNQPITEVELLSTFVHRLKAGDNHSIARVPLGEAFAGVFVENGLAKRAAELRAGRSGEADTTRGRHSFRFEASRSQEFNGAGLFYFAEFQALMERAHEALCRGKVIGPITHRDVFFLGNIRENEAVEVEVAGKNDGEFVYRVFREDGKMIACARARRCQ